MKKIILLLFISLPLWSVGQNYYEDFEGYTPGLFEPQWDSTSWGNGCPLQFSPYENKASITDTIAYSGNQCLDLVSKSPKILNCKWVTRNVPVPTAGTVKISYRIYTPLGKDFYIRVRGGANALYLDYREILFKVRDSNNISENYPFSTDTWYLTEIFINYDTDSISCHQNGILLTTRYFGDINGAIFDIIQFVSNDDDIGAYIDDFSIEQYLVSTKETYKAISNLKVYPNPTQGQLTIELDLKKPTDVRYQLIDIQGRLLDEWTETQVNNTQSQKDISHLANGMYFLQVMASGQVETRKIVVSH
jgi:hypothetical protein